MGLFKERKNLNDLQLDAQGRKLFFPWGFLSSGFIIESKEQEKDVLELLKEIESVYYYIFFLTIIYLFYYEYKINKITKNLQRSKEKYSFLHRYKKRLHSKSLLNFVIIEIISIACLICVYFFMFKRSEDIFDILISILGFVLFLYVLIFNACMIFLKNRIKS